MVSKAVKPPSISSRTWAISTVTGAGAFMAMLDSTVVNLALESIRADLDSTIPVIQWVVTGYLCALAVSLPAAAWLGSQYGHVRVWVASMALFVIASLLCALAPGVVTLIGARLVQGLAGGLMVPAGQAIVGSIAGKRQLGRVFGTVGFAVALGPAIGPAIAGFLLDTVSWRWLFLMNIPVGVLALVAAYRVLPQGLRHVRHSLDIKGLTLLGIGLPLLLFGATEMGVAGPSALTFAAVLTGVMLASGFVLGALRDPDPLINVRMLRRKPFASAIATTALTGVNMYGGLLLLPLYLQLVVGQNTVEAGLMLLLMGLGIACGLPVSGVLTDRYGARIVSLVGAVLLLLSTVPFLLPAMPSTMVLSMTFVVRGVGLALAQMPAITAAYIAASGDEMGDASTLVNIVQRVGGAVGAISIVIIIQQNGDNTGSYTAAFAMLAGISLLTVVASNTLEPSRAFSKTPST